MAKKIDTTEPSTVTEDVTPATEQRAESASEIVDRWFGVTFPGSIVTGTTEQWNFLCQAREHLKEELSKISS